MWVRLPPLGPLRGWYLGGEEFFERLNGVVKEAVVEKKRESFEGEAVSRHDEEEAERLLKAGMRTLGLAGIKEVKGCERMTNANRRLCGW